MDDLREEAAAQAPPRKPGFAEALRLWLKLGFLGFGGPAGQIALMHRELVEKRRWISDGRFLHALNYCMLLPGPEAQQLATYIGWLMHRTRGGIAAGVLFVLPGLFFLIGLSWLYAAFGHTPLVAGLFYGLKPAVTALVVQAVHRIGSRALKGGAMWAIAAGAFLALFAWNVPFPLVVGSAALIGYLLGRFAPEKFASRSGPQGERSAAERPHARALIDDGTPTPEHAIFRWPRLVRVLAIGGALWVIPMAAFATIFGGAHPFTQMGWFFTKAALLTFGGAYAVLPYIQQGAVAHYHWLTAHQMIDGLALGETTPGPLILVVAFVGFIGGYGQALLGSHLFLAGAVAAMLVTWFTFLPSFVFILGGGPFVESTHGNLHFTAPLTALTAAVVGVILNLAVFFAWHVFWPAGFSGAFDWISAILALGAATALIRFRLGVLPVLAVCAVLGMLLH